MEIKFKPEDKAESLEQLFETMFGRTSNIEAGKCVSCGADVTESEFRDEVSLREYTISGLCQKCQDEVFKEGE
mgnify:CR=1 FL=1